MFSIFDGPSNEIEGFNAEKNKEHEISFAFQEDSLQVKFQIGSSTNFSQLFSPSCGDLVVSFCPGEKSNFYGIGFLSSFNCVIFHRNLKCKFFVTSLGKLMEKYGKKDIDLYAATSKNETLEDLPTDSVWLQGYVKSIQIASFFQHLHALIGDFSLSISDNGHRDYFMKYWISQLEVIHPRASAVVKVDFTAVFLDPSGELIVTNVTKSSFPSFHRHFIGGEHEIDIKLNKEFGEGYFFESIKVYNNKKAVFSNKSKKYELQAGSRKECFTRAGFNFCNFGVAMFGHKRECKQIGMKQDEQMKRCGKRIKEMKNIKTLQLRVEGSFLAERSKLVKKEGCVAFMHSCLCELRKFIEEELVLQVLVKDQVLSIIVQNLESFRRIHFEIEKKIEKFMEKVKEMREFFVENFSKKDLVLFADQYILSMLMYLNQGYGVADDHRVKDLVSLLELSEHFQSENVLLISPTGSYEDCVIHNATPRERVNYFLEYGAYAYMNLKISTMSIATSMCRNLFKLIDKSSIIGIEDHLTFRRFRDNIVSQRVVSVSVSKRRMKSIEENNWRRKMASVSELFEKDLIMKFSKYTKESIGTFEDLMKLMDDVEKVELKLVWVYCALKSMDIVNTVLSGVDSPRYLETKLRFCSHISSYSYYVALIHSCVIASLKLDDEEMQVEEFLKLSKCLEKEYRKFKNAFVSYLSSWKKHFKNGFPEVGDVLNALSTTVYFDELRILKRFKGGCCINFSEMEYMYQYLSGKM